jgi:hypothetical protein
VKVGSLLRSGGAASLVIPSNGLLNYIMHININFYIFCILSLIGISLIVLLIISKIDNVINPDQNLKVMYWVNVKGNLQKKYYIVYLMFIVLLVQEMVEKL